MQLVFPTGGIRSGMPPSPMLRDLNAAKKEYSRLPNAGCISRMGVQLEINQNYRKTRTDLGAGMSATVHPYYTPKLSNRRPFPTKSHKVLTGAQDRHDIIYIFLRYFNKYT